MIFSSVISLIIFAPIFVAPYPQLSYCNIPCIGTQPCQPPQMQIWSNTQQNPYYSPIPQQNPYNSPSPSQNPWECMNPRHPLISVTCCGHPGPPRYRQGKENISNGGKENKKDEQHDEDDKYSPNESTNIEFDHGGIDERQKARRSGMSRSGYSDSRSNRRGGFFASLCSIPGVFADTLLNGELSI